MQLPGGYGFGQGQQQSQQPQQGGPPAYGQVSGAQQRLNLPGGLGKVAQPSGLPAATAFGLGFAAVVVALVFDLVFLKIHIPGVGGYAWYLTTALSFAGAGWASIMWTRAGKSLAMTAAGIAGVVYGIADLGLGLVVEDLSMGSAIVLGAQGVAIACVCGFGGIFRAQRAKEDAGSHG